MKFNELQTLALRKLQVKNLTPKLKNLTPKATNPTPNQLHLYTVPSLRVGRSALRNRCDSHNKNLKMIVLHVFTCFNSGFIIQDGNFFEQ